MRFYLLGIGGVSMSALAVMLQRSGQQVRGSDVAVGRGVEIVQSAGICVDSQPDLQRILQSDVVVFSSAIKEDDFCLVCARKFGKKVLSRGQLLGKISSGYENVVAIAGSHGKTTTTALVFEILQAAGKNPTLHLGGFRCEDDLNFHIGGREFFVTEACEFHNNFLSLFPSVGVVTNVEREHMDFFGTFSREVKAFEQFESQCAQVVKSFGCVRATNVRHDRNGGLIFNLVKIPKNDCKFFQPKAGVQKIMTLHMRICEEVNKENVIYAYLVAKKLGISDQIIKVALERFRGVKARFERKNCPFFDVCICDYAHHPTEIEKAIFSAKKIFRNRQLVVIFQPHTFSRTKALLGDFVKVFSGLENVVIFKTYSARESPADGVSGEKLAKILEKKQKNVKYFEDFAKLRDFLVKFPKSESALLFVGAGDLPQIAHKNKFFE